MSNSSSFPVDGLVKLVFFLMFSSIPVLIGIRRASRTEGGREGGREGEKEQENIDKREV